MQAAVFFRMFPLIFISTIRQIFCLSPLLQMCIVKLFLCEYHLNTPNFLLDYSYIVLLKWPSGSELRLYHLWCDIWKYSTFTVLSVHGLHVYKRSRVFFWLTVFSSKAHTYPLGSLSTNTKFPHSESEWKRLSRASRSRAPFFLAPTTSKRLLRRFQLFTAWTPIFNPTDDSKIFITTNATQKTYKASMNWWNIKHKI